MKKNFAVIVMLLAAVRLFAAADYSTKKQGVTINYRDGKSEHAKLDFIDEETVTVIKPGPDGLEQLKIPRAKVDSLSIDGKNYGDRFKAGEEGYVMDDDRVLRGIVEGLDETSFWRRLSEGGRTERLDRDKVLFIQFRKAAPVEPPNPPLKKITVEVPAKQAWTITNIMLKKGQRVYFFTDSAKVILCGGVPNVNADGVDPFTPDPKRPFPDAKACALIAKIGADLFRVGASQAPFVVKQDGELILGINDWRFISNTAAFSVMVVVQP